MNLAQKTNAIIAKHLTKIEDVNVCALRAHTKLLASAKELNSKLDDFSNCKKLLD